MQYAVQLPLAFRGLLDTKHKKVESNLERVTRDSEEAQKLGFALPPPIYAMGTPVVKLGEDNFRRSRQKYDALPEATKAIDSLLQVFRAEDRSDLTVPVKEVSLDQDGNFRGMPFTQSAFSQLVSMVSDVKYSPAYLSRTYQDIRVEATNKHISRTADKKLMFRTKVLDGKRSIFSVVSEKYATYDTMNVLLQATSIADRGRAEVVYDAETSALDMTILYHTDIKPSQAVAGEIFKAGLKLRTADNGSRSIQVNAVAWRNLCLNLLIIGSDVIKLRRVVHRGTSSAIRERLISGLNEGKGKMAYFADRWDTARNTPITNAEEAYKNLIKDGILNLTKKQVEGVVEAFHKENEFTVAGLVNGITRYAHTSSWSPSKWASVSDLEAQASKLLTVKVSRWN